MYLLECNPRLTASFAYYTQLEQKAGLIPLFYYHLDEFTDTLKLAPAINRVQNKDIIGTEITPKDTSGTTINKIHLSNPVTSNPHEITLPTF